MLEMTELVGEYAGELVGAFGLVEQTLQYEDLAAGQRERVRHRGRQYARGHGIVVETRGIAQAVDQLDEGRLPRRILARIAAEDGLHLNLRRIANTALDRFRHQRREAVGSERHPEQHDADDGD